MVRYSFILLAFVSLFGSVVLSSQTTFLDQQYALIEFFKSTNGTGWRNNSGWLSGSSVCGWYGIICDPNGQVIILVLFSCKK
jgi:hypothetical protein